MKIHGEDLVTLVTMVMIIITSTLILVTGQQATGGNTPQEASHCFQPINNIQILTPNDSSPYEHGMNLDIVVQKLNLNAEQLAKNTEQLDQVVQMLTQSNQPSTQVDKQWPQDCLDLQRAGFNENGKYKVYPDDGGDPFFVSCDMETDGGGWTVFQRREDGTLDFYQDWQTYKNGFGPVYAEHWLGNDHIHRLTVQKRYALRVDLWDWEDQSAFAEYNLFYVTGENLHFSLHLGAYNGTAGDSLSRNHRGMRFSTHDADHDTAASQNCAVTRHGAWWYHTCHDAALNGKYYDRVDSTTPHRDGVVWWHLKNAYIPLRKTEMKIRPV